jgi:serine/threonine protein phosphatase PrpC
LEYYYYTRIINFNIKRSFGDIKFKKYISCEPDIFKYNLYDDSNEYIIIASDGFWNVLNILINNINTI